VSEHKILYLSKADIESLGLSMREIIDALEIAFKEHGEKRVEMPPKPGVHTQTDAFIHAMPAYIPALKSAGVKWVSGYPENQKKGLPYISGLMIINDTENGLPLAVMDCTWITAKRTGAATALSAKYLARPESESVGILGCGVQGHSNLEALKVLFPLKKVVAYDKSETMLEKFSQFASSLELEVTIAKEPREAVQGLDMIVTAGPILRTPHATIQKDWMKEGAFASLVDFDSYWDPAAMAQASKFCTDDIPQLEHYRNIGYFQKIPNIYAALGELVAGYKPGRENESERTFACNLGLALDDMATAPLVYELAKKKNVGTWLPA
jgi:ornithine cyclodeaminase/alanine dehydrogenase